ncbi:hypothetical protein Tco_0425807 [Tanacetum coccineum]
MSPETLKELQDGVLLPVIGHCSLILLEKIENNQLLHTVRTDCFINGSGYYSWESLVEEEGEGPHETFQCQPMNEDYYHEQNSCYDSNSFGFDQTQPPQYTVNHPIFNVQNDLLNSQNKLMEQMTSICDMVGQIMQKKEEEKRIAEEQAAKDRYWKIPICYDDDEDYTIAITPVLSTKEPDDSLSMGDEHLNTIPETESDKIIKSSVENLVPIPSEFEDFSDNESECDMPVCNDFTTFSNPLFDSDDDFSSNDDESFSDEDVSNENFKIYSNPLFDEEIISSKIKPHHFNAESDLIESLLNRDISTVSYPKIDSLLEEFSGEVAHIDLIPPGIVDTDFDPKEEIILIEELFLSPSPIPVEDNDPFMEEIDIFLASDDSTPPGVESDYDSEGDILLLKELLNDDLVPLAEYNHFTFDVEPDTAVKNDFDELNKDKCFDPGGGEINVFANIKDDYFRLTFVIQNFLPCLTYPEVSPLLLSTGSEDTIFDPGIFT